MTTEMKAKIAQMQAKRQPIARVFQNNDGTWGNRYNFNARFPDRDSAEADARFCEEWDA